MGISVPNFLCQLPWQEVQNPEGLPYHGGSLSPCPEGLQESWGGQPTAGGCPSSSWVWGLLDVPRTGCGGGLQLIPAVSHHHGPRGLWR